MMRCQWYAFTRSYLSFRCGSITILQTVPHHLTFQIEHQFIFILYFLIKFPSPLSPFPSHFNCCVHSTSQMTNSLFQNQFSRLPDNHPWWVISHPSYYPFFPFLRRFLHHFPTMCTTRSVASSVFQCRTDFLQSFQHRPIYNLDSSFVSLTMSDCPTLHDWALNEKCLVLPFT